MELHRKFSECLAVETEKKKACINFFKTLNDLWYQNSVELVLFKEELLDKGINEILNLHTYYSSFSGQSIDVFDSEKIALVIRDMGLSSVKLDIAKLNRNYQTRGGNQDLENFIKGELKGVKEQKEIKSKDIILYGFGRIGRLLARIFVNKTGKDTPLKLRAIVIRGAITKEALEKRASTLELDSVHGKFSGTIKIDYENESLIINGSTVKLISASNPDGIDYTQYGIEKALLIDNTGVYKDKESLERHLNSKGINKVLLTAPGKGIPNIVYGVNHLDYTLNQHNIFSAASCTTNAIIPILKILEDEYGIENGHIETIHAYTNDQNLVDNMHVKYRRGRSAALNMVITETGAGKAVSKVIPELEGKLTSNAIRIPVPNGSLAILNINLKKSSDLETLNKSVKTYSLGMLSEQIKYSSSRELVSSDIIGSRNPSIFDSHATIFGKNGKNVILYIWYDNEYGYSCQVERLAKHIIDVNTFTY